MSGEQHRIGDGTRLEEVLVAVLGHFGGTGDRAPRGRYGPTLRVPPGQRGSGELVPADQQFLFRPGQMVPLGEVDGEAQEDQVRAADGPGVLARLGLPDADDAFPLMARQVGHAVVEPDPTAPVVALEAGVDARDLQRPRPRLAVPSAAQQLPQLHHGTGDRELGLRGELDAELLRGVVADDVRRIRQASADQQGPAPGGAG